MGVLKVTAGLLICSLAVACPRANTGGPPACADLLACTTDADCTVASSDCCPCSSGGNEVAVRKGCEKALPGSDCGDAVKCLAVYNCTGATAKCTGGRCTLTHGTAPPAEAPK